MPSCDVYALNSSADRLSQCHLSYTQTQTQTQTIISYLKPSLTLQIQGLPTMVFVGTDVSKPVLRTEGLLPASAIMDILANELT